MRAYQIMIFLMLFNISINVITLLGIFPVPSTAYNTDRTFDVSVTTGINQGSLWLFTGSIALFSVGGAIAGAFYSRISSVPADSAAAYGFFGGFFLSMTISTFSIFNGIAIQAGPASIAVYTMVSVFMGIIGVFFFAGLMQMIKGGWRTME